MKTKTVFTFLIAMITIAGCIYAGRVEYTDDVLSSMSETKYQLIRDRLGDEASQRDIVKEYNRHRSYYDSLVNN